MRHEVLRHHAHVTKSGRVAQPFHPKNVAMLEEGLIGSSVDRQIMDRYRQADVDGEPFEQWGEDEYMRRLFS